MERWRILCDAFTIPGLTFVMIGFLIMVANEGFFDMLSYAASKAVGIFLPGRGFSDNGEKYYDYVQRKRGNRTTGFGFLFVVGCVLMAFAFLFMFLFYRLYNARSNEDHPNRGGPQTVEEPQASPPRGGGPAQPGRRGGS